MGASLLIGPSDSSTVSAINHVSQAMKIPQISPYVTDPYLSILDHYKYLLKVMYQVKQE